MTSDLEQRVRATLGEDATKAPLVQRPPEGLRGRVRRRQARTAVAGLAGVAAVVALTVAVVQLFPGDDRFVPTPAEQHERPVFERTATIEGFTLTSPSDWYLVDYWPVIGRLNDITDAAMHGESIPGSEWVPGAAGMPVVQLTNHDLGLGAPICGSPTGDDPLPADGAGLYVGFDYAAMRLQDPGAGLPVWPDTVPVEGTGCEGGTFVRFGVRRGDQVLSYLLWYGAGPEASDEDRAQLEAIVEGLVMDDRQPGLSLPGTDTPGYVLWGGKNEDGSTWTIEARPTDVNVDLKLLERATDGSYSARGFGDFDVPPKDVEGTYMGVVKEDAERVEFRFDDGDPLVAQITDLPPSLGYEADAFTFLPAFTNWDAGEAVAVMPEPEPTRAIASQQPEGVVVPQVGGEGISSYRRYRVQFFSSEGSEGGPILMAEVYAEPLLPGGTWQRIQTSAFDPDATVDHATFSFPWDGTKMPYLTYGIASTDVDAIRGDFEGGGFRIPDHVLHETRVPISGTGGDEVFAWVTIANDPSPGTISATAADGSELASQPFQPAPEGAPLSSAEGTTVFYDDMGAYVWRADMTWSNQGILGDVTVQATPRDQTDHPERWPGHSQTLSLADGFSAVAATMAGPEDDGCLRTIIVGVFDPARVSSVTIDGEPLTMTTKDLGSVHADQAGNTVFSSGVCDVDMAASRIAVLDADGDVVVEGPLVPEQLSKT